MFYAVNGKEIPNTCNDVDEGSDDEVVGTGTSGDATGPP